MGLRRSICFTCVEVLAGFVGVHGAVADGRLHCPLWLDYAGAGKKLVDGRAEVCDLGRLQRPVVQLCLSHALSQPLGAIKHAFKHADTRDTIRATDSFFLC